MYLVLTIFFSNTWQISFCTHNLLCFPISLGEVWQTISLLISTSKSCTYSSSSKRLRERFFHFTISRDLEPLSRLAFENDYSQFQPNNLGNPSWIKSHLESPNLPCKICYDLLPSCWPPRLHPKSVSLWQILLRESRWYQEAHLWAF